MGRPRRAGTARGTGPRALFARGDRSTRPAAGGDSAVLRVRSFRGSALRGLRPRDRAIRGRADERPTGARVGDRSHRPVEGRLDSGSMLPRRGRATGVVRTARELLRASVRQHGGIDSRCRERNELGQPLVLARLHDAVPLPAAALALAARAVGLLPLARVETAAASDRDPPRSCRRARIARARADRVRPAGLRRLGRAVRIARAGHRLGTDRVRGDLRERRLHAARGCGAVRRTHLRVLAQDLEVPGRGQERAQRARGRLRQRVPGQVARGRAPGRASAGLIGHPVAGRPELVRRQGERHAADPRQPDHADDPRRCSAAAAAAARAVQVSAREPAREVLRQFGRPVTREEHGGRDGAMQ